MLAYTAGQMAAGLVVNLVVSVVCGLVVFFYGRSRGAMTLATIGLILCVVIGFFLSFFAAIILAIAFFIAIWATTRSRRTTVAV